MASGGEPRFISTFSDVMNRHVDPETFVFEEPCISIPLLKEADEQKNDGEDF
jgi:hypothetical protein